ncbi:MFS transporter [Dactylosporangium sp. CS-033363]|uniref:MFS transporter n=1 Tax=Dactylosporangium sp. CS-033363 TaxID=3239935 RepID=UPI003D8AFF08
MTYDRRPLAALCLGWFMVIVDMMIVNVALPSLGRDLHASVSGLQWVVDGYTVAFAGLLLTGGWLGDRLGSRRVFLLGLAVFGAASVGCALAPALGPLLVARTVQGLAAALMVPASLALVQSTYPDFDQRARAVAGWALVGGVAGAVGPLAGGLLTSSLGWRAIFWVNVPVTVVALWLVRRFVGAAGPAGRNALPLDAVGQVCGAAALLALTAAVVEAGRTGLRSALPLVLVAAFVVAAVALVVVERRGRRPLLDRRLLAEPTLAGSLGVGLLINFAYYGAVFVIGLWFQQEAGYGALATGLAIAPITAATLAGTWLGGRLNRRHGPRRAMLAGLPLGAAGLGGLAVLVWHVQYTWLIPALLLGGFGISMSMVAATSAVVEAAPEGRAGLATGLFNASRQVGSALGIAALGALLAGADVRWALLTGAAGYLAALGPAAMTGG